MGGENKQLKPWREKAMWTATRNSWSDENSDEREKKETTKQRKKSIARRTANGWVK